MKNIIYILIILFSCNKNIDSNNYSISSWTKNLDSYTKLRTELRLAFGKTVANALRNTNFRKYIKNISRNDIDSSYNEIVFSIHKDDKVDGTKTFAKLLEESEDYEVKSLFGDSLIIKTLAFDQCVCLKIPDILFEINWDIYNFAPCVYVETPSNLNGMLDFMVYHYSGYQDLIKDYNFNKPNHYYIMIKYSEDYTLINTSTWQNEKGISFFEFLPQAEKDWNILKPLIQAKGLPSIYGPEYIFVHKYESYKIWSNEFSYKGSLLSQTVGCGKICLRDCADQQQLVPTILDYIQITNPTFYGNSGLIFRESASLLLGFWVDVNGGFKNLFAIPSLRYKKMGLKPNTLSLKLININYTNLGYALIPFINLTYNFDVYKANKIDVKYEITSKLTLDYFQFLYQAITYNDEVLQNCNLQFYPNVLNLHSSFCSNPTVSASDYCEKPLFAHVPGSITCYFNY